MEFEKAMRQAAENGLIFNETYMDPKLPEGVWICDNAEDVSDIRFNAVCLGSGVDYDAIARCRSFFQLFEYVVIVTPNAVAREKLVKEVFPRLPTCTVYVINDSGFKNCKTIREYIETYGSYEVPNILT